jgi:ADP-ribose pyrophosphatase YjhB (NUDIX family)
MNYCSHCGNPVALRTPDNDSRQRHICLSCSTIHYQNPNIIAGCLATYGDKVLLCRRGIEPQKGYWTLPAGFLENGETTEQGAARESWEEARAKVEINQLYGVFNVPHISQVYMIYRSHLIDPTVTAGEESLDAQLFSEEEIPWDQLAFSVVETMLRKFFNDRKQDHYPLVTEVHCQVLPNAKPQQHSSTGGEFILAASAM